MTLHGLVTIQVHGRPRPELDVARPTNETELAAVCTASCRGCFHDGGRVGGRGAAHAGAAKRVPDRRRRGTAVRRGEGLLLPTGVRRRHRGGGPAGVGLGGLGGGDPRACRAFGGPSRGWRAGGCGLGSDRRAGRIGRGRSKVPRRRRGQPSSRRPGGVVRAAAAPALFGTGDHRAPRADRSQRSGCRVRRAAGPADGRVVPRSRRARASARAGAAQRGDCHRAATRSACPDGNGGQRVGRGRGGCRGRLAGLDPDNLAALDDWQRRVSAVRTLLHPTAEQSCGHEAVAGWACAELAAAERSLGQLARDSRSPARPPTGTVLDRLGWRSGQMRLGLSYPTATMVAP